MLKLESTQYSVTLRDAWQALIMLLIGNVLVLVMGLPDGQLPTLGELKLNLIMSLKFAVIPYILKNFFKDDVKVAQKTIEKAEVKAIAKEKKEDQNFG